MREEIARQISDKPRLEWRRRAQITKRYTENVEAYRFI
jgi:hypothetical protein